MSNQASQNSRRFWHTGPTFGHRIDREAYMQAHLEAERQAPEPEVVNMTNLPLAEEIEHESHLALALVWFCLGVGVTLFGVCMYFKGTR